MKLRKNKKRLTQKSTRPAKNHAGRLFSAFGSNMKKIIILFIIILLSGCTTVVSMYVDSNPLMSPEELDRKLGERYHEIGVTPNNDRLNTSYFLSEWHWRDKPNGGFLGHNIKDGKLWIWIAPAVDREGAPELKEKILKLIHEISPEASVEINEYKKLDVR
jgi:hypothetical protein